MPSNKAKTRSSRRTARRNSSRNGGSDTKPATTEGPEAPPSRSRFDGDLKSFTAYELTAELKQCKIDMECGPGPATRNKIAAREENIRDELHRRNSLTAEALNREEAHRGRGAPKLPDATIQTVLSTREVLTEIERWRSVCYSGGSDKKTKNVGDLVYEIQQTVEEWVNVLEEDGR